MGPLYLRDAALSERHGSELYTICRLDNIDKHRNLLLMATVADKYRLDATNTTMSMTVLERGLPIHDGVKLAAQSRPNTFTQIRVSLNESDCGLDPTLGFTKLYVLLRSV